MTRYAVPSDPTRYRCAHLECDAVPVIVTGDDHGAVYGSCPDHLPDQVTFPVDVLERWASSTTYLLTCGHYATVPGPCGATTGRAWCDTCNESAAIDPS